MRLVFFSLRGSSPMGTPLASGVQAAFRLEDERQFFLGAAFRFALQRGFEQHRKHVFAADVLYHHLVFARRAVGGGNDSSTCAGKMLQPFT